MAKSGEMHLLAIGRAMKPSLLVQTGNDALLSKIISCISDLDCSSFFPALPGRERRTQGEAAEIIGALQIFAKSALMRSMPDIEWHSEHCPSPEYRDRIDIFGKGNGFLVSIELDTTRADQIAKKFVSRMAILPSMTIYYIAICYPGTTSMNMAECEKYIRYCAALADRMNRYYAGFIINY